MHKQKVVATRLTLQDLAKARDALLESGITADQLDTVSQILRLSVFSTIMKLKDPKSAPSEDSLKTLNITFTKPND